MKHFVLTRFNLATRFDKNDNDSIDRKLWLSAEYLDKRFLVFEKYTFPSLMNQTNQDFQWLVLFHSETPEKYIDKIKEFQSKMSNFKPMYLNDKECMKFGDYLQKYISDNVNGDEYITSRIDNDDIFSHLYIETVQAAVKKNSKKKIVSYYNGLQFDTISGDIVAYNWDANHFLAMHSFAGETDHILMYNHTEVVKKFDSSDVLIEKTQLPMWVELITDTNVINHIRWDREACNIPYFAKKDYEEINIPWKNMAGWLCFRGVIASKLVRLKLSDIFQRK